MWRRTIHFEGHDYPVRGTCNGTQLQNGQGNDLMTAFDELEMPWLRATDVGQKQELKKELARTAW